MTSSRRRRRPTSTSFVRTLPDGYDDRARRRRLNLSSGQKQLLTIARAFLANPSILILDEATSNVDTRTEVLIQEAMSRLRAGTNQLRDRAPAFDDPRRDTIVVMDHGQIVEQGSHATLLERQGLYYDLYESQFTEMHVAAS